MKKGFQKGNTYGFKKGNISFNFKGDLARYETKHQWVYYHYGKANHCENDCTHKATIYQWANISGRYLRDINDWKQLCPSCHQKMDDKYCRLVCKNGHTVISENLWINSRGDRVCKKCKKENAHREYLKHKKDYLQRSINRRLMLRSTL